MLAESNLNCLWYDIFETDVLHISKNFLDFFLCWIQWLFFSIFGLIHDLSFRCEFSVFVDVHKLFLVDGIKVNAIIVFIVHVEETWKWLIIKDYPRSKFHLLRRVCPYHVSCYFGTRLCTWCHFSKSIALSHPWHYFSNRQCTIPP